MKVKLKVDISGSRNGASWPPRSEVVELPDAEGADLCAAGLAEPVAETPVATAETATQPEPETRRGPGRPRKADAGAKAEG